MIPQVVVTFTDTQSFYLRTAQCRPWDSELPTFEKMPIIHYLQPEGSISNWVTLAYSRKVR